MKYRQLGNSGVRVSVIGLGTNQFGNPVDAATVKQIVDCAFDLGINLIDTAEVYADGRSEETLGEALKGRWDRVVLTTKVGQPIGMGPNERGASRYRILNAVDGSLRRLQTDHIDVYQIHIPDETTPQEETLRALDDLVRSGKVRYLGASNFAAWQMAQANMLAELRGWASLILIETHYNMLQREAEKELLPFCNATGVGLLPFYPLAGGFLTGKYMRGKMPPMGTRGERDSYVMQYLNDATFDRIERLAAWVQEHNHTLAELAHAWLLSHPRVSSVISGATKLTQIQSNARAADWELTPDEVVQLNAILDQAA